ncbi:hypothetical protein BW731_10615 [Vagococcus martis]|uniref:Thioredoxin-like fold domain-containing protein n=1 Tax=Vagococcus martis TaxID=1768210 RepID=A0A1V4DJV6_9ENTE|nr:thioredoxin domain-containing protein [Vagococcus martis]OPF88586.1 hypothetical protein BW731_10615 [Vagococcus martis]
MGTKKIDPTKVTSSVGIKIGKADAPNLLFEFVNLRCPFCKQWWDEKLDLISKEVNSENLHYVIKLFNKDSASLSLGNVMHEYVPANEQAIKVITDIYNSQSQWGSLSTQEEVREFAEETLGLIKQDNQKMLQDIVEEAANADVHFVPTLIVDDFDFDQKISNDDFLSLLR